VNKLNPTLEERDTYSWIDRKLDTDTWSRPPPYFEPAGEPPISIMLPGQRLKDELDSHDEKNRKLWHEKLKVKDPDMHFYR